MKFQFMLRVGVAVLAVLSFTLPAQADDITFNFDDGTNQGWTNILTSPADSPTEFEVSNRVDTAQSPHSGSFFVLPKVGVPFSPTEDSAHETLVYRSPEFVLGASGNINFFLGIGSGGAISPGAGFGSLPANSASNGFLGLGIRRVSDGAYVLFARRASNSAIWEEFNFDTATLSTNSLLGATLTLDLIDQHDGSFGWVALDTVTLTDVVAIPEPATFGLLGFGSIAAWSILRRRS